MSKREESEEKDETVKRFRFFDPSLGVLGLAFVIVCVISCLFYLDYRSVIGKVFTVSSQSERFMWLKGIDSSSRKVLKNFLDVDGDDCDLFDGEWIWDENHPLYESKDCSFLDEGFRCVENGRPDLFYTKWRWQPRHCNLPRFEAKTMLEKLQNRRIVFAGDSIARNQWESLLCMLASAVPNKSSIYEVNGSPITKHKGFLVFRFSDYNCTVEYYRSPFLVSHGRPPPGTPRKVKLTIALDRMDWNSDKWKSADLLILNAGHWWNYEKTMRGGSYFQEGTEVKLEMEVGNAYQKAIETVARWIQAEVNTNKTQVFFRTFAPVHFRGGEWRTGGHCHQETLPELGSSLVPYETWTHFKLANEVFTSYTKESRKFNILNITGMTARRKDGHSSLYYLGDHPASLHRQDCSHWCLPGVPDSWNELLYSMFLKHENGSRNASSV